ncbi:hypothetical protein [Siphonobacter sp. SORGH_AS_0500]|uniref:hypothetical protein n=1 Tax=Siphonobacter sp. SORGH_AS_0500 TaxID=1864824 RepID=UPI002866FDE8|nr:hypothetical protein [Siphonobacter sp. SORGH_AS_0500]MDR6193470.1 hypothetical protein [Siphonobacter sp. SORGH_AS_0500]
MKFITCILLMMSLATVEGLAQSHPTASVVRMQTLLQQTSDTAKVYVPEKQYAVQINQWIIPLDETTLMDWKKQDGAYAVQFFLQKGTAITMEQDPGFRRAYGEVKLASKQACQEFIRLFDRLRVERKRS